MSRPTRVAVVVVIAASAGGTAVVALRDGENSEGGGRAGTPATAPAYDVRNPTIDPPELWQVPLGNCIESTPAVWMGRVHIGTRGGFVYGIGDG